MNCPNVVWALRQRGLSAPERVVLMYLADKANSRMTCWPTLVKIAKDMDLSRRTVQSATVRLATLGLIRIDAKHRHSHTYHILRYVNGSGGDPTQPQDADDEDRVQILHPNKVQTLHPSVQILHPKPMALVANAAPKTDTLGARFAPHPPKIESPKEERGGRAGKPRSPTPLPAHWQPSVVLMQFGLSHGLTEAGVRRAADQMRDWSLSGDHRKADWDATFRMWIRREAKPLWERNPKPVSKLTWARNGILGEKFQ